MSDSVALEPLRAIRGNIAELKTGAIEIKECLGMMEAQGASFSRRIDRLSGDVERTKRHLDLADAP